MKMDGRDSAEYQFWLKRDIMVILEFDFKSLKDKIMYSVVSPIQKETKNVKWRGGTNSQTKNGVFESF